MSWLTNEVLFYGGIIITVCSILSAVIYFCVSKIKKLKLKAQLESEYGERKNYNRRVGN